ALDTVHKFTPKEFSALSDLLSPELINECLVDTGVATIRKGFLCPGATASLADIRPGEALANPAEKRCTV
ncbi:transposase domain-containing protein, partial [Pluralibacter gergoviae]|uniref:transposase domain-containing protein n=1 Tax=Pluralibacter gergoviae TaxID=61647 RepID=UPI00192536C2